MRREDFVRFATVTPKCLVGRSRALPVSREGVVIVGFRRARDLIFVCLRWAGVWRASRPVHPG